MSAPQHDHHCLVSFGGSRWRIDSARLGGVILEVTCRNGCCGAIVDLRAADLDSYAATALMIDEAFALRQARGLPVEILSEARH